jgi:O-methyltransferase
MADDLTGKNKHTQKSENYSEVKHNVFILNILNQKERYTTIGKIIRRIITAFNTNNKRFKISIRESPMLNIEQAMNIYHLLSQILSLKIPGDLVELGCFEGRTSLILQKTLDQFKSNKKLHVYDAFEGLPEKNEKDGNTSFKKGQCKTTKDKLIQNFNKFNVRLPKIHTGWFKDTLSTQLPNKICFAHLDGDFYSSIKESLKYIYPKLSPGAIVVIDDYCDPKVHNVHNVLPGVKKACDEFFANKKEKINVLISGDYCHAYFKKI